MRTQWNRLLIISSHFLFNHYRCGIGRGEIMMKAIDDAIVTDHETIDSDLLRVFDGGVGIIPSHIRCS